ncbi:MAG: chemotaxis-specific protein-glutamate methyltransferase CheB [Chthoniobacteraceae bacterium]
MSIAVQPIPKRRIRVMILEDSRPVREMLEYIIGRDPRLEVAESVGSAEEALRKLHHISPDVISMDIRLPGMNGFEATQRIMAEKPTPIVVVSASVESEELKISMNALRAGALCVLEKPVSTGHQDYAQLAERLCTQLVIMSDVRVIRQRVRRTPGHPALSANKPANPARIARPETGTFQMLGIVASTGGPNALVKLLGGLEKGLSVPVLLVQHITPSFLKGFVSWLNDISPMPVIEAADGQVPKAGVVYVAPADRHLILDRGVLRLDSGPPVSVQKPSGTVLLRSMARSLKANCLGVLLTGMGEDGATGLRDIRDAGGYTIAEDETTAVVYGMPAAAVSMGAVCESLPLDEIASRISQLLLTPAPA